MRRLVALVAAAALPLAVAPTAASAQPMARDIADACPPDVMPGPPFRDVAMYEDAISCVYWWRVTNGTSATTYSPHHHVSRGQMAAFVARALIAAGMDLPDGPDAFTDDDTSTYENDINALAAAGVVRGTSATSFSPREHVTRAQMAAFLVRAHDALSAQEGMAPLAADGDHFADDDTSPLEDDVNKVATAGIAGGHADGTYRPLDGVRRDHMALFLSRWLDHGVEMGLIHVVPGGEPPAGPGDWAPPETDGFVPIDPAYYEEATIPACDSEITIVGGDVREVMWQVTHQEDGTVLIEYQGDATLDITRASDGAMLDELDISGVAHELYSPDGLEVTFTLEANSLILALDPLEFQAYEAAGLPPAFYFSEGTFVEATTLAFGEDPDAPPELASSEVVERPAEVQDLCEMLDQA